ncbi:hypothetical protein ACMFMG_005514 [Clarireedia jacksonii]
MASKSTIQESPSLDFTATLKLSYAESKWVAEGILTAAHLASGGMYSGLIPVTILRVTQVGGSTLRTDPPWPTKEWLYPVLKASKSLNLIVSNIALIDWLPID